LFSCSLAECVPAVQHNGAANGEEGCGLEASGWEVSLGRNARVSILVIMCLFAKVRGEMACVYLSSLDGTTGLDD
jgi:hypothetical protein